MMYGEPDSLTSKVGIEALYLQAAVHGGRQSRGDYSNYRGTGEILS